MNMVYRPYEEVWHPGDPKKEKMIIAVGIVTAIMLTIIVAAGWGYILGVLYEPDTETHPYNYDPGLPGFTKFSLTGWYYDSTEGNSNELLQQSKYISCFKSGGHSEEITFAGKLIGSGIPTTTPPVINWYRYTVYLDDNGDWSNPDYTSPGDNPGKIYWKNTATGMNPGKVTLDQQILDGDNYIPS